MSRERNDDRDHWRSGAEGPRGPEQVREQERIAEDIGEVADYQVQPDAVRPDEASTEETGTARRAERAAGLPDDPETRDDAERAYRESRGQ
jgi:hypothetical protein